MVTFLFIIYVTHSSPEHTFRFEGETSFQKESKVNQESSTENPGGEASYFGAVIALAIFAVVSVIVIIVAVVLLVRRQSRAKALEISEGKNGAGANGQQSHQGTVPQNPSFKVSSADTSRSPIIGQCP